MLTLFPNIARRAMQEICPAQLSQRGGLMAIRNTNEIGFSICRLPSGALTHGAVSEGTPVSVNISITCPNGSEFVGLAHTHPKGVAWPWANYLTAL